MHCVTPHVYYIPHKNTPQLLFLYQLESTVLTQSSCPTLSGSLVGDSRKAKSSDVAQSIFSDSI